MTASMLSPRTASRRVARAGPNRGDLAFRTAVCYTTAGRCGSDLGPRSEVVRVGNGKILWAPGLSLGAKDDSIKLAVCTDTVRGFRDGCMNHKIGEYAMLVRGDGSAAGAGPLHGAYALYRGLLRPIDDQAQDRSVFVYVTNPTTSWAWRESEKHVGPFQTGKPNKSVFLTYVKGIKEYDVRPEWLSAPEFLDVQGVVLYWEWVRPVLGDPPLPHAENTRYATRIW